MQHSLARHLPKHFILAIFPKQVNSLQGCRVVYVYQESSCYSFKSKEITMKQLIALIATAFAVTAFAAEPAKKEEKKVEAKPAVTAPAPAASTPAKADAKSAPAGDKKAEAAKK
jgi:hypothetical protein